MKKFLCIIYSLLSSFFLFSQEINPENLVVKNDYSSEQILNLKCNLTFENLLTQSFYGNEITIEIYSNNKIKTPQISQNKNTIEISSTKQKYTQGDICSIIIYIPKNFTFENIIINSKNGNISLSNINTNDNLKIYSEKSNVSITNSKTSYLCTKLTTGSININGQILDYFDLNTTSGNISIDLIDAPIAKSILKSNSGNITVTLPNYANFDFSATSQTDFFWDQFLNKSQESAKRTICRKYNSGGTTIIAETTSGKITLKN